MSTRIANDMNNVVALGTKGEGINKYYCGKYFGSGAGFGSDGTCGPDDGLQCRSCKLFTERVDPRTAEIARLRADNLEYSRIVCRQRTAQGEESAALRKELDIQKKMVFELETELGLKRKKIRELESAAGGEGTDEWTRACKSKNVWPRMYKPLALVFHPDKNGGDDAFFKLLTAKNEAFTGKGLKSAEEREM